MTADLASGMIEGVGTDAPPKETPMSNGSPRSLAVSAIVEAS
jgi:hypothetical protein